MLADTREGFTSLVTDMVMPEMSGIELAESIAIGYPEIQGAAHVRLHARRSGATRDRERAPMRFSQKPFTPSKLAARVRELLDGGIRAPECSPRGARRHVRRERARAVSLRR